MSEKFKPIGPSPIQEPFVARLNRSAPWGSGNATGAINTLAVVQHPTTKDGTLYAGSVSGGVWGRNYRASTDSWGPWRWLSNDERFEAAQSISKIKVLKNQRWLIAAAGSQSSFGNLKGLITSPLQIGKRNSNGSIDWVANTSHIQDAIYGQSVTALETSDNVVAIGTKRGLYVSSVNNLGKLASIKKSPLSGLPAGQETRITDITRGASGRLFAAAPGIGVFTASSTDLLNNPETVWQLISGTEELLSGKPVVKLSTSSEPSIGRDVLYIGTAETAYEYIHRAVYNEDDNNLNDLRTIDVIGKIGSDQAEIHSSFAADPTGSNRVFAGGNWMGKFMGKEQGTIPAYPYTFTGGIVGAIFNGQQTTLENHFASLEEPENAAGTAPHADSRDLAFLTTRSGTTRIIEADDGGIYIKNLNIQEPWIGLNEGLRTTESFSSDWSNIGKLAITALQDNAVALGRIKGNNFDFANLTGGDGALARFDDGIHGSDGKARAYYTGQQYYFGGGLIQSATYSEEGLLEDTDFLSLEIADKYGNFQGFPDYEIAWSQLGKDYYFYYPAETNDYRAGDLVITGVRNIYETIIPPWELETAGVAKLVPLLDDSDSKYRKFTAIAMGSKRISQFTTEKPKSWDALYTSFVTGDFQGYGSQTHFYGRKAQEIQSGNWFDNKDSYKLQDLTAYLPEIAKKNLITGITFNPSNPDEVWLSLASDTVTYGQQIRINSWTFLNNASYIIHSKNGGITWQTVAESGKNGIPINASLQQITYAPATTKNSAELFIGGYGGVWRAAATKRQQPLSFTPVGLEGTKPGSNLNLWNTDLQYDPKDDVVTASIMGQGVWLLNRAAKPQSIAKPSKAGLRISNLTLPQDVSSYKTRKGRSVLGWINIGLERDTSNRNKDVSVELELPTGWNDYIELKSPNLPVFDNFANNKVTLNFPKGVDSLSFYIATTVDKANRPDKIIDLNLVNPINATIADPKGSVYLYATGNTIYLLQESPGVFYSNREQFTLPDPKSPPSQHEAQKLSILLPRANLNPGQKLFWYPVNSEGSVEVVNADNSIQLIKITDPNYQAAAEQKFNLLATASLPLDSRAFSPEKAAKAFSNPAEVIESEGISIGEVTTSINTSLVNQNGRFAFALTDPNGATYLSPLGFRLSDNITLDNTVNFGKDSLGTQVILAPALGELFIVDDTFANDINPIESGKLRFDFNIANFSQKTGYGLFRVDDANGRFYFVDGELQGTRENPLPLEPGSLEYAKEAIRRSFSNSLDGITGLPIPAYGTSAKTTIDLAVGNAYGIYITPNKILEANSSISDLSEIRFSVMAANPNSALQHVSMGTGYFSFEESAVGSTNNDNDYNDLQFLLTPIGRGGLLG